MMESASFGIKEFNKFNLNKLDFLASPKSAGAQIGWNIDKSEFYLVGGGIAKESYFGFGNAFQALSQMGARYTSNICNKNPDVFVQIKMTIHQLDTVLDMLDRDPNKSNLNQASLDKLNIISKRLNFIPEELIKLKKTWQNEELSIRLNDEIKLINNLNVKVNSILKTNQLSTPLSENSDLLDHDWTDVVNDGTSVTENDHIINQKSTLKSIFNTACLNGQHIDLPHVLDSENVQLINCRKILSNPGAELNGEIITEYHSYLNKIRNENGIPPIKLIHNFYHNGGINNCTLANAKSTLDSELKNWDRSAPVSIPLFFSSSGQFEINHIVTILIKDNCVEYFDPKGANSSMGIPFAGKEGKLSDFLEACRSYTDNGKIVKNNVQLQHDINNCGVFSCDFIERRTMKNEDVGSHPLKISFNDIIAKRANIYNAIASTLDIAFNHSTPMIGIGGDDIEFDF